MKASLTLNHKNQIALFYDEPLDLQPEWASIDVEHGEIYIGGKDTENKIVKLDQINQEIYERVNKEDQILLILVKKDDARTPINTIFLPLMVSQQL